MGGLEKGGGDEGREGEDCGICRRYFKRNVVGEEFRSNHRDFPCVRKPSEASDIMCGSNSFTSRPSVDPRGCVEAGCWPESRCQSRVGGTFGAAFVTFLGLVFVTGSLPTRTTGGTPNLP